MNKTQQELRATVWNPEQLADWMTLSSRIHLDLSRTRIQKTGCHLLSVFSSQCDLFILTRGREQGVMKLKRCKGAAKALCTACQITFLMASLSDFLISVEKERTSGGSIPFSSLSQQNHSPVSFYGTFAILSLKPCISSIPAQIQMAVMTWSIESRMQKKANCIVSLSVLNCLTQL